MYETGKNRGLRGERYLVLVQVTTAEPVSYAKSRPCFERGMARDAVASATRDAGDIRCEVGIAPVFFWSPSSTLWPLGQLSQRVLTKWSSTIELEQRSPQATGEYFLSVLLSGKLMLTSQ